MVAGNPDAPAASNRTVATPYAGEPTTETRGGTLVTAEIPAVPVAKSYGVLLPDGSVWYPGSKRKLPAPLALRLVVWTLAFLVALGVAGLLIEHFQPTWANPLRRTASTAAPNSPGGTTGGGGGTSGTIPATMEQVAQTATGTTYSVPTSPTTPYLIVISTQEPCYVVAVSEPSGQQLLNTTIPADSSHPIYVTGSVSLWAAAGGSSLIVKVAGDKQVGSVPLLKDLPYPYKYTFEPATKS